MYFILISNVADISGGARGGLGGIAPLPRLEVKTTFSEIFGRKIPGATPGISHIIRYAAAIASYARAVASCLRCRLHWEQILQCTQREMLV